MTIFSGTSGDDVFIGSSGDDSAAGNGGNDLLIGNAGADTLDGGDGDDTLYSDAGSAGGYNPWEAPILDIGTDVDTLTGGDGSDRIFAGYGDNVDGGADGSYGDYLFISFQGATSGVTADFDLGTLVIGGGTITGIEHVSWVQGSEYDDYVDLGIRNIHGYNDYAQVFGMGGNDHLIAEYYTAVLDGGDGNDIVDGRNSLYLQTASGGAGDDVIYTFAPFSVADGGAGNDTIYSHNRTYGGEGNDVIVLGYSGYAGIIASGDGGDDHVRGNDYGAEWLEGNDGNDLLEGLGGDDDLKGGSGSDVLVGGRGNDTLTGGADTDRFVYGQGDGSDLITDLAAGEVVEVNGYSSAAWIYEVGTDVVVELSAEDRLTFTNTSVAAVTAALTFVGPINDTITGGADADDIRGYLGDDILSGAGGNDLIEGGSGADRLSGGDGDDILRGGEGNDILSGGTGIDNLLGGEGADTFIDTAANLKGDTIDFGSTDKIVITDASLATFTFSLNGETLIYTGGSVTLGSNFPGTIVASAAAGGGVQLTVHAPPLFTFSQIAEQLVSGYWVGDSHRFDVAPGGTITVNLSGLTAAGQTLAIGALGLWSDITGINFVQVTSGGQIVFDDNEDGAFSDGVWANGVITSAYVNVSTGWLSDFGTGLNSYSFQTYIHEVGHALGLGHAGNYNETGFYRDDALFVNDAWSTTVMSYFSQEENGYFGDLDYSLAYVATPMVADIVAIQQLYGLSTTTRAGDTIYGFNSNAGDVFNADLHTTIAYTVFDSGGVDTLDYSEFSADQLIDLAPGAYSNIGGLTGNVAIAFGTTIENASGGSGSDQLFGNAAGNRLNGGGGNDMLSGGLGSDTLIGGAGFDTFRGTAAELSGDTITDFATGERIIITDASLSSFTYVLTGATLTYSGGSLSFGNIVAGTLVASAAAGGGVQLVLSAEPPPPPPGPTRATLTLTESGQDFTIGGDVLVYGTTSGGEVVEILHGDVLLDASFNIGGDTVVLPGNAATYSATLAGSFVTIAGGDVTVAIPVGVSGLSVQFADSTRTLRFDTTAGQVLLGTQPVTATTATVAASGPPLVDPVEIGPDSLGRLVLAEAGQDIDIGGNVTIFGSTNGGEVVTVLAGTIILDASFNVGGDTVVLPGNAGSYSATLAGSFVTIAGGDISIAIPVGVNGLTVDFADADKTLRFDTGSGQVMLGHQVVTSSGGSVATAEPSAEKDSGSVYGLSLNDFAQTADVGVEPRQSGAIESDSAPSLDLQRFEFSDSFNFG